MNIISQGARSSAVDACYIIPKTPSRIAAPYLILPLTALGAWYTDVVNLACTVQCTAIALYIVSWRALHRAGGALGDVHLSLASTNPGHVLSRPACRAVGAGLAVGVAVPVASSTFIRAPAADLVAVCALVVEGVLVAAIPSRPVLPGLARSSAVPTCCHDSFAANTGHKPEANATYSVELPFCAV